MPAPAPAETLLFALGNEARQDDGLGWAFAEAARARGVPDANIHLRYHLQVEDAEAIARAERVIFVDACREDLPGGFAVRPCEPAATFDFTTHALPPEAILFICRELYGPCPAATTILIAGEAWGIGTGLSARARRNLRRAQEVLPSVVRPHSPPGLRA